jgi:glycosyltransferase involved in cell wall biosynthesis
MRITFVLPMYLSEPAGGFKVVYEYANHLQARGHQITLVHPRNLKPTQGFMEQAKIKLWPYKLRLRDRTIIPWFKLSEEVKVLLISDLREEFIPPGEVIVATGYQTVCGVNRCAADKGQKYYLIQHYETWAGREQDVNDTWRLPLHKIVIAKWLLKLAERFGEGGRTTYIPNGLDFSHFRLIRPVANRQLKVAMLAHSFVWKGTADGLAALEQARKLVPEMRAVLFGTQPPPPALPNWIEYRQSPTAEELMNIYNSCAVFLHPSWAEGWPLPPAEAMACGCALVAAANPGVKDYAEHGLTALMAEIKNPAALAQLLVEVLRNAPLRQQLAEAGRQKISEFTWARAVGLMEDLFISRLVHPA